jgi:hypothetical protein
MKMRRHVVVVIHRNHNPEKPAYERHAYILAPSDAFVHDIGRLTRPRSDHV